MTKVNWVENDEYHEVQSETLLAYFTQVWNSGKKVLIHDPEVSDDQPEEHLRVLDDSPENDWVEFLKFTTAEENHKGFSKHQKDGSQLVVIHEAYPGVTELPPLYLLLKD